MEYDVPGSSTILLVDGMQFVQSKNQSPPFSKIYTLPGRRLLSYVIRTQLSKLWFDPEWVTESHRHAVYSAPWHKLCRNL